MKTPANMLRGLAATFLGLFAIAGAAADARADANCNGDGTVCPIWYEFDAPTDANIGGAFTVEFTVHFPSGDYRNTAINITVPSGLTVIGSASPTSQEFDNAVAITGGRRWNQQNTLDFSGGAAIRKFNITVSTATRTLREGTLRDFTVTATGDVALDPNGVASPFANEPATHRTTLHGTVVMSWLAFGYGAGGGAIISGETTPRPGIMRRYVFLPQNTGNALLDAPTTFNASWGPGYYFVRAFGDSYSTALGFLPDPNSPSANLVIDSQPSTSWVQGAGSVTAHSISNNVGVALYVDLFIPCDDFGQTAEENAAQGSTYLVNATADAEQKDANGNVIETFHLDHAAIGTQTLTAECGAGGSLNKIEEGIVAGGTGFRWEFTLAPPFGVDHVNDAMLVDVLPPGIVSIGSYGGDGTDADFERWVCNFSAYSGYFTVAEFLARRGTDCRLGYSNFQAGDTHVVYYAPTWHSENGGLRAVHLWLQTNVDMAWALANPGARLENVAYFNGDIDVFPDLGDTEVEVATEDPWEIKRQSDPIASSATLNMTVSRNGNPSNPGTSLIDANGGVGNAYAHLATSSGLYAVNPVITTTYPPGIIIDTVHALTSSCTSFPGFAAPSVWTSPVIWTTGDSNDPFTLNCGIVGRITFHVDPNWPWVDGQAITFNNVGTAANAPADSAPLNFYAQVTTGMDVLLEGGCWTAQSEIAPPQPGLTLFKASAVNRGSDDLADMELRFIIPAGGIYRTAIAGPDFPAGGVIEVSRDHGATWSVAPTTADVNVTDVRVTGIDIAGEGLNADRPSFYVGVILDANAPQTTLTAGAWVATDSFGLGQTPTKEVAVDASLCAVPCVCPDPTPNDICSSAACDLNGECQPTQADNGFACEFNGNACVTTAQCQAGVCTATATVQCGDADSCTNDACNPQTGLCEFDDRFDCGKETPVYLPVTRDGKVIGSIRCVIAHEPTGDQLKCDTEGEKFKLYTNLQSACGG